MQKEIINILTIDVEDYYMVSAFDKIVKFEDWDKYESRIVQNTEKVLSLLQEFDVKATFFVLGWVAERFPELIKKIFMQGHEIASHGYSHKLVYNQSPDEFRMDVRRAKKILEDILGQPVMGYRAPSYSITRKSLWAIDILIEEGFRYDSSIFPIYHDRGGLPNAERFIHEIKRSGKKILEVPLTTIRFLRYNIPVSGGGYFRLFPFCFIRSSIKRINQQNRPVVFYIHPWEIDPHQPRLGTKGRHIRHYLNLDKTQKKMLFLLNDFKFNSIREIMSDKLW